MLHPKLLIKPGGWPRAALLALALLLLVHLFVFRWVSVHSTSMYGTLLPGDLVGVQRWPVWTGFRRGDILVFRDPLQDRSWMARRDLLVKRIVGMPGDELRLEHGVLTVNGEELHAPESSREHFVHLRTNATVPDSILAALGLPPLEQAERRTVLELSLRPADAAVLEQLPGVDRVRQAGPVRGTPRHIFPFSPWYKWNADNYGPLHIPKAGDEVPLTVATLPLYDRIISHYEGHRLGHDGPRITVDGVACTTYRIEQDYYFVLGDSRHHSADSRHWGFVPADHAVGRAVLVLGSKDPDRGGLRPGRWYKRLP